MVVEFEFPFFQHISYMSIPACVDQLMAEERVPALGLW